MEDIAWCRQQVFKALWSHYYQLVPFAPKIEEAFAGRKDAWIEDHVAFRTLPGENTGKHILQKVFELIGYERKDDYHFEEKRLDAFWMSPDQTDGNSSDISPKIFVSELIPDSFTEGFQKKLRDLSSQVSVSPLPYLEKLRADVDQGKSGAKEALVQAISQLLTEGPAWARPDLASYELLRSESDYAAWTYLFGHQINHFTVSVHLMDSFSDIADLGKFLENDLQIPMNHSGGLVKGNSELLLEQIATMAAKIDFQFQDGNQPISYGFVEFAKRYELPNGPKDGSWNSFYQGFVAANADKIFESTYK